MQSGLAKVFDGKCRVVIGGKGEDLEACTRGGANICYQCCFHESVRFNKNPGRGCRS